MIVFGKERDYIIHNDSEVKGFFGEYRWLSNYHVADVYFEGLKYPSTENAYQAAKSMNLSIRKQFTNITCSEAKKLGSGRTIADKLDLIPIDIIKEGRLEEWTKIKPDIMFMVCYDKFFRHTELRKLLLDTDSKYLEETNHWQDRYYGVCDGEGKNMLGKILMKIREIIAFNTEYSGIPLDFFDRSFTK